MYFSPCIPCFRGKKINYLFSVVVADAAAHVVALSAAAGLAGDWGYLDGSDFVAALFVVALSAVGEVFVVVFAAAVVVSFFYPLFLKNAN